MSGSGPPAEGADGRRAAVLAVAGALSGGGFVTEALRARRAAGRLRGREAGLAMQIGQGTLRHIITIEHVLSRLARYDPQNTPARLRAILCTGAYQVIWMDRVPPFAAVSQAVELARRLVRGRSSGMVNAVLRRLAGAIDKRRVRWQRLNPAQVRVSWDQACQFLAPVLPDASRDGHVASHLAAAAGEHQARYEQLVRRHGDERAEAIAWASQAVPVTVLQRNSLRLTESQFAELLRGHYPDAVALAEGAAFLAPAVRVVGTPAFADGLIFIQDTTARKAALTVEARRGERVLDLCAAPGGKSMVLALQMSNHGEVLACDRDAGRVRLIDENARRLGLSCIRSRLLESGRSEGELPEGRAFDAALVDVPCTNTGVIARRPEARLGLTAEKLRSLVVEQRQLLRCAAEIVRPGGRVVYSTCSLEPEENEQVVAAFLADEPAWRLDRQETTMPRWGSSLAEWRDGGYFARLVRADSGG